LIETFENDFYHEDEDEEINISLLKVYTKTVDKEEK